MSSEQKPSDQPQAPVRSQEPLVRQIQDAMKVLEQASCGAIGKNGATLEEMEQVWNKGGIYGEDAYYDTCQHAWRLLEIAVNMSNTGPHDGAASAPSVQGFVRSPNSERP